MNKPKYQIGDRFFFLCGDCENNLIQNIFHEDEKHLAFYCPNCELIYIILRDQDFTEVNYIFSS